MTQPCPKPNCTGEVDVPPDPLDGLELECPSCGLSTHVFVFVDGTWALDAVEAGETE